jgi:hypothetical protein
MAMKMPVKTTMKTWRLAVAPALIAAGTLLAAPAGAQLFGDRGVFGERPRSQQTQFRDFFQWWGGERGGSNSPFFGQPARPPADFSKAPPPRKQDTPPASTVLIIGDSLADWLGYGLEEALADTPEIGVVRKIKGSSGLVRYEAKSETPDWPQAAKDMLASERPNAIVVMLGLNDRQSLRERVPPRASAQPPNQAATQTPQTQTPGRDETPAASSGAESTADAPAAVADAQHRVAGASYEFHTDKWAEFYGKRIDELIAVLRTKGVPVLWVGLPALRGPRSTTDMSYLDELYRAHAEKAGIVYIDIWNGFVDDAGRFTMQGPDFEGQIRKLRSGDGVHFTKPGAVKLGYYVERELRRVLSSHVLPVALPGPEQSPAKGGARPAIGPVVPLGAVSAGEAADLLGAGNHPAQAAPDPIVTRVLSRGEAIGPQPGRADDFSWPRSETAARGAAAPSDAEPGPPPAPPAKGAADKGEMRKPGDAKPSDGRPNEAKASEAKANDAKANDAKANDSKAQAMPDATSAKPHRSRADLDGVPRPPLPVGPR